MRRLKIKKLNNQGSTFILAVLVITLLTTLALALANASISNMMMKSVDRGSKKTFYTAESLLDQIRAGVGHDSVKNLASAYQTVLTNLVDSAEGTMTDNDKANENLKKNYIDNVLNTVTAGELDFDADDDEDGVVTSEGAVNIDAIKAATTSYISGKIEGYGDKAEIKSIGHIKAYKEASEGYKWAVIIEDVSVSYKEEKAGEILFSNITADLLIEYPNTTIDFTTTNRLTDFIDYSLIADNNINISGKTVNVNSSVYAGDLIDIGPTRYDDPSPVKGADVTFKPSATGTYINVVCGGNDDEYSGTIRVGGNATFQSSAKFESANIWCTNLATRKMFDTNSGTTEDATAGAVIDIDANCSTFVRDDLSVDAQKSQVTIRGEYYGYMIEGVSTPAGHKESSALIVNGRNSVVNIATKYLWLGGRAYIDFKSAGTYLTGESLALKGDQEAYLIPADYLGKGFSTAVTNPMSSDTWDDLEEAAGRPGSTVKICELPTNYFARPYLNPSQPFKVKEVNDMVYLYWNFAPQSTVGPDGTITTTGSEKENSKLFIEAVLSSSNNNNAQVKLIRENLKRYTTSLFGGSGLVDVNLPSGSEIYATGILMEASGGNPSYTTGSTLPTMQMYKDISYDLRNRYTVLTHLLASLPWYDGAYRYYANQESGGAEKALLDLKGYRVSDDNELETAQILSNIIDLNFLSTAGPYNPEGKYISYGPPTQNYVKMITTEPVVLGPEVYGGIIVTTRSITLNSDFHGLLIAGGDIILNGDNITITTNANMVEDFILGREQFEDETIEMTYPFKQYFKAYKMGSVEEGSSEEVKIENVDYKDLVNFENWRKYEEN